MFRINRLWTIGLFASVFGLVSCIFDDHKDATSWLDQQGTPVSTRVIQLDLGPMFPKDISVGSSQLPFSVQKTPGGLGSALGTRQELFYSLLIKDTAVGTWLSAGDSSWATLLLSLDSTFYLTMSPSDPLPYSEDVTARVAWELSSVLDKSQIASAAIDTSLAWDTTLQQSIQANSWHSSSTPMHLQLDSVNARIPLVLPDSLRLALKAAKGAYRLQLRVSLDGASRIYRIQSPRSSLGGVPRLFLNRVDSSGTSVYSGLVDSTGMIVYAAQSGFNLESCLDCMVLHGGRDSVLLTLPSEQIFAEIKRQLGDSLGLHGHALDSVYTQRFVLQASIFIASDTVSSHNDLGLPVQLSVESIIAENKSTGIPYALLTEGWWNHDSTEIQSKGFPELLFLASRDTLELPITKSMRYGFETNSYSPDMKIAIRTYLPVTDPLYLIKSTSYPNGIPDYATYLVNSRWDLGRPDQFQFRIRVWLTEKR